MVRKHFMCGVLCYTSILSGIFFLRWNRWIGFVMPHQLSWPIFSCYLTSLDHADRDTTSKSHEELRLDTGGWEKHVSSHDTDFWDVDDCLRPENGTIISIITGRTLVGMIITPIWDGILYTATAHSWMQSSHMRHTAFGTIGKISASGIIKRLTRTGRKW